MKNKIEITQTEIEDHRNYYGTLGQQIDNIKAQYEQRIQEAIDANATELKTKLVSERDNKIKDITANFEDDEHVRKRFLLKRKPSLINILKQRKGESKNFEKL